MNVIFLYILCGKLYRTSINQGRLGEGIGSCGREPSTGSLLK